MNIYLKTIDLPPKIENITLMFNNMYEKYKVTMFEDTLSLYLHIIVEDRYTRKPIAEKYSGYISEEITPTMSVEESPKRYAKAIFDMVPYRYCSDHILQDNLMQQLKLMVKKLEEGGKDDIIKTP